MEWRLVLSQILLCLGVVVGACSAADGPVQLHQEDHQAVMDNGLVRVTLSVPDGYVTAIKYNGIENVLEPEFEHNQRGYWDMSWKDEHNHGGTYRISSTKFDIIKQEKDQVELSFSSTWRRSAGGTPYPVNIDKRFVMLAGQTGFYSYGIFERLPTFPSITIFETRIVLKLDKTKFQYMAVSDERQRKMPSPQDRASGKPLSYPEAVRLTNPADLSMKGQVDDKYQYSTDNKDGKVHGWVSTNPSVGFWMITPSNEFRTGGPLKQDLTSHVGPTMLSMFVSVHYAGVGSAMYLNSGSPWKKVFGPVFMYLNTNADKNPASLWNDAKSQMIKETKSWPYKFPASEEYLKPDQRGGVMGILRACDPNCVRAVNAHVGLAAPGAPGSWEFESEGYQFWTTTDDKGGFVISGVRPGTYDLHGWVPGVLGNYKHNTNVVIKAGSIVNLGHLSYNAPRSGPTLWEIGIPDRTAAEFHIPDPVPTLGNPVLRKQDRFRQYGLWLRYSDLYPKTDLEYTVGISDYRKDWFYAHVNRVNLEPTTWKIIFYLKQVSTAQNYALQVAIAASNLATLDVRVNNGAGKPLFTTGQVGKDNAISRHAIHGTYAMYSINIPGSKLVKGKNTIYLTQPKNISPFQGLMYDYLRLEGPARTRTIA